MTADTDRWDTHFVEATFLNCDPLRVVDPPTGDPHVMLWFDVDGRTHRLIIPRSDAERMMAEVAESLEALDSD